MQFEHGGVDGPAIVGAAERIIAGVEHAAVDVGMGRSCVRHSRTPMRWLAFSRGGAAAP